MRIAIITANFGGYEELKPAVPQDGCSAEFVCVTDDLLQEANGWSLVPPVFNLLDLGDDNMRGKPPKMLPWLYTTAGVSIWLDASFRITSRKMAVDMAERAHPVAQFSHPERDCVYEEAVFSSKLERYSSLPLMDQIASYAGEHPAHWGLWAAGVIVRHHVPAVVCMGELWLQECRTWGPQDQVSQAVALRRSGLRPASLSGSLYSNPWLIFEPSRKHTEARK